MLSSKEVENLQEGAGDSGDDLAAKSSGDTMEEYIPNYCHSLVDVSSCQQHRRIYPIISFLKEQANLNKVTVNELLGLVTKQINLVKQRYVAKIDDQLMQGKEIEQKLSLVKSSHFQQTLNFGRFGY